MNEELKEIKEYIIKMKRTYTAFGNDTIGEVLVCEEMLKYIEYMEKKANEQFKKDEVNKYTIIELAKDKFDKEYLDKGLESLLREQAVYSEIKSQGMKIKMKLSIEEE